jgi:hypothetical protein
MDDDVVVDDDNLVVVVGGGRDRVLRVVCLTAFVLLVLALVNRANLNFMGCKDRGKSHSGMGVDNSSRNKVWNWTEISRATTKGDGPPNGCVKSRFNSR